MCGICGIVARSGRSAPEPALLNRMIGRLAHRGPDSSGCYRDRHAALGHTRLSIIDLAGGSQPLSNEDGSLWLTFNGEIFNYVELRDELRSLGHVLRTQSDTEAIVHAWEQWGADCFSRFNGQWALGIWDARKKTLVLSRDRLGIRPLFYTYRADRFIFGSEIKALFADPDVPRGIDPAGLAEVFTFWCPVAPRTAFSGVYEVRPGHYLELESEDLTFSERPFWQLDFSARGNGFEPDMEACESELVHRLKDATRLRFTRSDVPVGAYLSGGLDSSVIAAVVAAETRAPLTTFSLRFSDEELDEGIYQRLMVERIGTEHYEVFTTRSMIADVFPDVVRHTECPILRTAPAPLFLLSRLTRESGYKVVVTGEGSDEVFVGYDIFRELKVRMFLARDPCSLKRPAIVERLYPWMVRTPAKAPAFANAFFSKRLDSDDPAVSHRPRWDTTRTLMQLLAPELHQAVVSVPVEEELLARLPRRHSTWDPLARAQWLEMTTILPGYILSSQGDRMMSAHGVEGRFPFLDHGVVEFADSLPSRFKLMALDEKHLLKRAYGHLVPPQIIRRPKQPYHAPDAASFFSEKRQEWLEDLLDPNTIRRVGLFKESAVAKLVEKCRRVAGVGMSNSDNMRLVGLISTMLIHRQFIEGDGAPTAIEAARDPETIIDHA